MTKENNTIVPEEETLLKLFAQTVKKNARSLSNPAEAARYIVKSVFQNAKMAVLINGRRAKTEGPVKAGSRFFVDEKDVFKYLDKSSW